MNNSNSSDTIREVRDAVIQAYNYRALLQADHVTCRALGVPIPCLAAITVTRSGLILIGPPDIIRACRDPVST